ncbi:MAG: AAA family ATPase [Clostridia bacterium]|nr:AAA family ATPase [Clostridia bacterium]
MLNDIKASAKRFWGKHSIIAIILHEVTDKSKSYVFDNISDNFKCVLDLLTTVSCCLKTGNRRWNSLCSPIDVFESPSKGILKYEKEYELDLAESVLSDFFTSINSNINKVYYEREYNDKVIKYTLYFEKFISGQYRQIPFSRESTGNYQLLRIFSYIISSSLGGVVAIDEADSGIHDYLFQKILHKIVPHINGQLIMTTHNTMLMESDFSKNSTYILKEEFEKMVIKAISEHDKRTYTKNNIRNKYLNGEYGGLPKTSDINFKELIESIYNAIKPLEEI